MTDRQWGKCVAVFVAKIVLVVVIGLSLLYGIYVVIPDLNISDPESTVSAVEPNFTDLVQESIKGVIHLQTAEGQASGFVVGPRLIVTARHCVEGVEDFLITTADGHQVRATRAISDKRHDVGFIWIDDLACIAEKCEYGGRENGYIDVYFSILRGKHDVMLHPLLFGSIKDCVLGQDIYIVGSPFGRVNFNAVSRGIISGLDRDWDLIDRYTGELYGWAIAFTSDSSASPGNSGGPVFDTQGRVIGVLVGVHNSTVNCIMPCDLFMADLDSIRLMFTLDRYELEETLEYDEWYNYFEDAEYYD